MSDPTAIEPQPAAVGGVPKPPFARIPEPEALFSARASRFRALAAASELGPYLTFLAGLSDTQAEVAAQLPEALMPDAQTVARARDHAMPPLHLRSGVAGHERNASLDRFFAAAAAIEAPPEAREALARVAGDMALRDGAVDAITERHVPGGDFAEHVYVAAALQVYLARRAARLDAGRLVPVGTGLCPSCGGPPVSSIVVGWIGAEGARYCCCALCGTLWNVVRITCTLCGSTAGIGYAEVEDGAGTIKAETCDACGRYAKILYANKDHRLDPVADDVASLGLDMLLRGGGYTRGAYNPLLFGY